MINMVIKEGFEQELWNEDIEWVRCGARNENERLGTLE